MSELTRIYRQSFPAVKLVGKCYGEQDKRDGTFSAIWGEWFQKDLFAPLTRLGVAPCEDGDAYIGLSRCENGKPYQYWIGVFLPVDAPVPTGYDSVTLEPFDAAVCWVRGREPEIYSFCCLSRLKEEGFDWAPDRNGIRWCFERYVCPRFTEPDGEGCIILDQCYRV